MSGENNLAIIMVQNAHKGVWLSNNENPYKIKWGTLRMDLHHLESHKMKGRQYYKPLINVWRYMQVPFPPLPDAWEEWGRTTGNEHWAQIHVGLHLG